MDLERWKKIGAPREAERHPEKRASVPGKDGPDRQSGDNLLAAEAQDIIVNHTAVGTALTQLGPYKIEAKIGHGGMGEVFRAHDTRLHRTVAVKVLPHNRLAAPESKRRFLLEARAVSALNHPNIVTLHDIASDSGIEFLVMEYVEGRSLDKLITPRGLPITQALASAAQIAAALAAAHATGIVHRDIKPSNVMVTSDGQVKVLDFGLAKLSKKVSTCPEDETETQESALTEIGMVMGTVAYMSPEQASGGEADYRTDIFSLGIMLYEMVTGRRPFSGSSTPETLNAIINSPIPPIPRASVQLNDVFAKALAKEPRERYQMQPILNSI